MVTKTNDDNQFPVQAGGHFVSVTAANAASGRGAAGENRHPLSGPKFSPSDWQGERQPLFHEWFLEIEREAANGATIIAGLRRMARRLKRRSYRSRPSKKINASLQTVSRWFYAWRANGRTLDSLRLHYVAPPRKSSPELGLLVTERCLNSDVASMAAAIRVLNEEKALSDLKAGRDTLRRSIPSEEHLAIQEVLRTRRAALRAEKAASRAEAAARALIKKGVGGG